MVFFGGGAGLLACGFAVLLFCTAGLLEVVLVEVAGLLVEVGGLLVEVAGLLVEVAGLLVFTVLDLVVAVAGRSVLAATLAA